MATLRSHLRIKHFALLVGIITLTPATGCDGGGVQAVPDWGGGPRSPYVPDGFELVFEDNFDQLRLMPADGPNDAVNGREDDRWQTYFAGWNARFLEGNNDQALKAGAGYRGRGGKSLGENGIRLHEVTDQGTLKLYAYPTPTGLLDQFEMPYLGGMISGENQHAQTYGYWEVRLRYNSLSTGHHWAIWLIPSDHSWPPEIDMIEVVGSNPENQSDAEYFIFNSILSEDNNDDYTRVLPPRGREAWYTIGFLWDENDMRWFLDGQEVRRRPSLRTDKELYFLVSPEVGGNWVGAPDDSTDWPTEIEIDYVRIYRAAD